MVTMHTPSLRQPDAQASRLTVWLPPRWYYHVMMIACSLYMSMLLTDWSNMPAEENGVPAIEMLEQVGRRWRPGRGVVGWQRRRTEGEAGVAFCTHADQAAALQLSVLPNYPHPHSRLQVRETRYGVDLVSFWVKILSQWVCLIMYGWTLLAPYCLRDVRDFGVEFEF